MFFDLGLRAGAGGVYHKHAGTGVALTGTGGLGCFHVLLRSGSGLESLTRAGLYYLLNSLYPRVSLAECLYQRQSDLKDI